MAATNPLKVRDLVAKYGWQIQPYLANIGVNLLSDAQILFVDSGATNTLDADDTVHGHSFENPLATIDYAIGLCTASQGDIILVAPGHAETLTGAADITLDVIGVSIIGIGNGMLRPTLSIATDADEAAPVYVSAANTRISNLIFKGAKATTGSQDTIEVEANDVVIENCIFYEPANTNELAAGAGYGVITIVDDTSAIARLTVKGCTMLGATGGGDESFISVVDGSNGATDVRVEDCHIQGTFADGIIQADAGTNVNTRWTVKNCDFINDLATGGAGACIQVDSGAAFYVIGGNMLSADGDAEPIADDAASYLADVVSCEVGAYGVKTAIGSATDWSA